MAKYSLMLSGECVKAGLWISENVCILACPLLKTDLSPDMSPGKMLKCDFSTNIPWLLKQPMANPLKGGQWMFSEMKW